MEHLLRRANIM